MRWPDSGEIKVNDHKVFYSGTTNGKHEHGVGVLVTPDVAKCVLNFTPISHRVMLLQLQASPNNINIIQVYAPTADKEEEEVIEFYHNINQIIDQIPKHELLIVMGDFNAKLGAGYKSQYIGIHGLGERNPRGDLMETFAETSELVVLNTFFKLPARRLYTWKSPQDKPGRIVRNQIDFMLVNKRFRNSFKAVKTYPGADLESDHVPLVGVFQVRMKKVSKKITKRYNMRLLKEPVIAKEIEDSLNTRITDIDKNIECELKISKVGAIVQKLKEEHLKNERTVKIKTWMTDEILEMMEKRRQCKHNTIEYRDLKNTIRRKIREAKEKDARERCEEIERLQKKHDSYNVHRKVKEATNGFKRAKKGNLTGADGKIVIDKEEKKIIWKDYLEKLFSDQRALSL